MKMFNLFVCPTTSSKVSPFTLFTAAVSNIFRNAPVGKTAKAFDILHQVSLALKEITRTGLSTVPGILKGHVAGQQHIYAPVAQRPINRMLTGSHLIRFSNGRTPYITKQVIF